MIIFSKAIRYSERIGTERPSTEELNAIRERKKEFREVERRLREGERERINLEIMNNISQPLFSTTMNTISNISGIPKSIKRKVNVWIQNHDSQQPLLVNRNYQLMINVKLGKNNTLVSVSAVRLEKFAGKKLEVAVVSNDLLIKPPVQVLELPESGDSEHIAFEVTPILAGKRNVSILFYYKKNLLQMLSISIDVYSKHDSVLTVKNGSELIRPQIVLSSDRGFESVLEIDRQA